MSVARGRHSTGVTTNCTQHCVVNLIFQGIKTKVLDKVKEGFKMVFKHYDIKVTASDSESKA